MVGALVTKQREGFPVDGGDNMAIDGHGRPLPMSSGAVRDILLRMLDEGNVLAVVLEGPEGIGVQVFGPPSEKLGAALDQVAAAFRTALKGH